MLDEVQSLLNGAPYHIGIVVPDVDEAMAEYTALFGMQWGPRIGGTFPVGLDDGKRELTFDAVYSMTGPVRIELAREIPGSPWVVGNGLHHIGFWVDDVPTTSEQLIAAGYPIAAALYPVPGMETHSVAMHRGPQGMYVEVVSQFMREAMESTWIPTRE